MPASCTKLPERARFALLPSTEAVELVEDQHGPWTQKFGNPFENGLRRAVQIAVDVDEAETVRQSRANSGVFQRLVERAARDDEVRARGCIRRALPVADRHSEPRLRNPLEGIETEHQVVGLVQKKPVETLPLADAELAPRQMRASTSWTA